MRIDELRRDLAEIAAAGGQVTDHLEEAVRGGRRRRRAHRVLTGGCAAVALLAAAAVAYAVGDRDENPVVTTSGPTASPSPCPGSVVRRINGGDPGADALPHRDDASTDVVAAVDVFLSIREDIFDQYPGAVAVELGPGFGRAWTGEQGGDFDVVDVDDIGILVYFDDPSACPVAEQLHRRVSGVPVFFFVARQGADALPSAPDADAIVYLAPDALPDQADAIAARLDEQPGVSSFRYLNQQATYLDVVSLFAAEQPELIENLTPDDMPTSFQIDVDEGNCATMEHLRSLRSEPGVREVIVSPQQTCTTR